MKGWCGEGLIEGGEMIGNPNYVLVARSLSAVSDKGEIAVQVMNIGPMEVTLHKGTRIANLFFGIMSCCLMMLNSTLMPNSQNCLSYWELYSL